MTLTVVPASMIEGSLSSVAVVATRTAMKELDTAIVSIALLTEDGRSGMFRWSSGDYSTQIAADTMEGIYVKATAVAATSGSWVRIYSGAPSVKWFGAVGDGVAADLPSLQACTDLCVSALIPNGVYKTDGPWLIDDGCTLHFESRDAEINSTSVSAIIRPRGYLTTRNFHIVINNGTLRGTGKSGPVGIDFSSTSMGKIFGTFITYVGVGVKQGGTGSQGAFYNEFHSVDITTVTTGYQNGTLANSNTVYGGRVTDCVVGTDDDDNSCNTYDCLAIESFTTSAHRISNSGSASQRTRSINCRWENVGGVGIGADIKAAAQATIVSGEFHTGLATAVADSGTLTDLVASY